MAQLFGRDVSGTPLFDLAFARAQLEEAGFSTVDAIEAQTPVRFLDVGAVVYFLRAILWEIEGFDVERDRDSLLAIHARIEQAGELVFADARFLIEART